MILKLVAGEREIVLDTLCEIDTEKHEDFELGLDLHDFDLIILSSDFKSEYHKGNTTRDLYVVRALFDNGTVLHILTEGSVKVYAGYECLIIDRESLTPETKCKVVNTWPPPPKSGPKQLELGL